MRYGCSWPTGFDAGGISSLPHVEPRGFAQGLNLIAMCSQKYRAAPPGRLTVAAERLDLLSPEGDALAVLGQKALTPVVLGRSRGMACPAVGTVGLPRSAFVYVEERNGKQHSAGVVVRRSGLCR